MLEMFAAQIMAAERQRRYFHGVRLDGPVADKPSRWRSFVAALFTRSAAPGIRIPTGLGRVAAA